MRDIPDDLIIRCMERTGYPPWIRKDPPHWEDYADDDEDFGDGEVFYGNETEGW